MLAPERSLPENHSCIIVIYDVRDAEACEALHRARSLWQDLADIEAPDEDHFVLILHPGGALRLAA